MFMSIKFRGTSIDETNKTQQKVRGSKFIAVKFQLRSSINVRLTESSLYNRFRIERSPKMGFGVILGQGRRYLEGKYPSELRVFRHLCPDLTRSVRSILYGYSHLS